MGSPHEELLEKPSTNDESLVLGENITLQKEEEKEINSNEDQIQNIVDTEEEFADTKLNDFQLRNNAIEISNMALKKAEEENIVNKEDVEGIETGVDEVNYNEENNVLGLEPEKSKESSNSYSPVYDNVQIETEANDVADHQYTISHQTFEKLNIVSDMDIFDSESEGDENNDMIDHNPDNFKINEDSNTDESSGCQVELISEAVDNDITLEISDVMENKSSVIEQKEGLDIHGIESILANTVQEKVCVESIQSENPSTLYQNKVSPSNSSVQIKDSEKVYPIEEIEEKSEYSTFKSFSSIEQEGNIEENKNINFSNEEFKDILSPSMKSEDIISLSTEPEDSTEQMMSLFEEDNNEMSTSDEPEVVFSPNKETLDMMHSSVESQIMISPSRESEDTFTSSEDAVDEFSQIGGSEVTLSPSLEPNVSVSSRRVSEGALHPSEELEDALSSIVESKVAISPSKESENVLSASKETESTWEEAEDVLSSCEALMASRKESENEISCEEPEDAFSSFMETKLSSEEPEDILSSNEDALSSNEEPEDALSLSADCEGLLSPSGNILSPDEESSSSEFEAPVDIVSVTESAADTISLEKNQRERISQIEDSVDRMCCTESETTMFTNEELVDQVTQCETNENAVSSTDNQAEIISIGEESLDESDQPEKSGDVMSINEVINKTSQYEELTDETSKIGFVAKPPNKQFEEPILKSNELTLITDHCEDTEEKMTA